MIATVDLGTTVTKVDVWQRDGWRAGGREHLVTEHPQAGRDEQDPARWWPALVAACRSAREADPEAWPQVEAIGLCGARQTIVAVAPDGTTMGPALLWSDRRARAEAAAIAERGGGFEAVHRRTGQHLDGGAVAAKLAWLDTQPLDTRTDANWVLTPRDLLAWRLTGVVATDATMATASGLYDADLRAVPELVGRWSDRLPPVVEPGTIVGALRDPAATGLGLRAGTPVVIGAGDRACEVLGTGTTRHHAMVSWGTTANVSRPVGPRPDPVPPELTVTRAARTGEWQVEAGLSAAGSLLSWLAARTGCDVASLVDGAARAPAGANGVVVLPWLGGARAPWWRDDVDVEIVGAVEARSPGDLARAALEGVARDVARSLGAMGEAAEILMATGRGASVPVWIDVLTSTTAAPAVVRRSAGVDGTGAASVGAALVAAGAIGLEWDLDELDPVAAEHRPDPELVDHYAALADRDDAAARAALAGHRPDTHVRY